MLRLKHYLALVLAVGVSVAGYLAWHIGFADIFSLLAGADRRYLYLYFAVSLAIAVMLTVKWTIILHAQKAKVPFHRLFAYRLVGYAVNYLTPTMHVGSEPIRAYLLKREGVPIDRAFSNVIIDKTVELFTNIVFFFIGALVILNSVVVASSAKIALLCISLVLMLLMGLFIGGILSKRSVFVAAFRLLRLHRLRRWRHIEGNLARIETGVGEFFRHQRQHFIALLGVMVVLWCLMYLEYRSILLFLGHEATVVQIFLILTGVGLAYAIPVPAAMGTLELGQVSAAKVLNLGGATGVTLAFIVRARDLMWAFLGLGCMGLFQFSFKRLARQTRRLDQQFEKGTLPIRKR